MGNVYHETIDLFEKKLDELNRAGGPNEKNVEFYDKLTDILGEAYDLKVCKEDMEDGVYGESSSGRRGYSRRRSMRHPYMGEYYVEGSYAPDYGMGWSGNYAPRSRNYVGEGNYNMGYSNTSGLKAKLHQLMNETSNEHEKMMLQSWIDSIVNM